MSGGNYSDPIDIGVEGVPTTLLTAIADNLRCLHKGNGHTDLTEISVDGDGVLDIGLTDQTFKISGTNTLKYITTTGRQLGNTINISKSTGEGSVSYGESSAPSGSLPIYGNGLGTGSITWYPGRLLTLVYMEDGWHHDMVFS